MIPARGPKTFFLWVGVSAWLVIAKIASRRARGSFRKQKSLPAHQGKPSGSKKSLPGAPGDHPEAKNRFRIRRGLPLGLPGATSDYRNPGDIGYLYRLGLLGLPLGLLGATSDYQNPGDPR
jgi:hypothetical protein